MPLLKKLIFSIPFLIFFYLFNLFFRNFISQGYSSLFSLDLTVLIALIMLTLVLVLALVFFTIFGCFSQDYRFVLPINLVASVATAIFLPLPIGFIAAALVFGVFSLVYVFFDRKLKTYLNFQPNFLLTPTIKNLGFLIILIFSLVYYQISSEEIQTKGFEVPDSILNAADQIQSAIGGGQVQGESIAQLPSLKQEDIDFLKEHPELLKERGIDPAILDNFSSRTGETTSSTQPISSQALKATTKNILESFLKPYQGYIPLFLAATLFTTLESFFWIISIPLPLFIWVIFYLLEKSGFIKFTTEMRPVRKLIIE